MTFVDILSCIKISAGAAIMLLSIFAALKIRREVHASLRKKWFTAILLMNFFLAGYIVSVILILSNIDFPFEIVTASVFLGGAIFVYIVMKLSGTTIRDLKEKDRSLKQYAREIYQRSEQLAKEVNERKAVENELRRVKDDWEKTFNSITDMITIHDRDLNIIQYNRAAKEILQLPLLQQSQPNKCYKYYHGTKSAPEGCPSCNCYNTKEQATFEIFEPHLNKFIELRSIPRLDADNNIEGLIHVVRDISERKRTEELVQTKINQLNSLRSIDKAILATPDMKLTLDIILPQIITELCADAAGVLRLNEKTKILEFLTGTGFSTPALMHTNLKIGEGNAGLAVKERRIVTIQNIREDAGTFSKSRLIIEEGFVSYYAAPLIAKGRVLGVMELFKRSEFDPGSEWFDFFETVASQAAIALDNASMFYDLEQSNVDLKLAYDSTIEGWARALDFRDNETEGHSRRVTDITLKIARLMGIEGEKLVHIRRGALLHDIGKLGVPDSILLKPDKLDDEEWKVMKRHPVIARDILSPIDFLRPAIEIPYCHHEKWDGTGYPGGLKGDQIPVSARIFSVVDVWDALSSDRPYRPSWPRDRIIAYIKELSGSHFDPIAVNAFLMMLSDVEGSLDKKNLVNLKS